MKWSHMVKCECRVYGRQHSDSHSILEEVRAELFDKFPEFVYAEPGQDYLPLLEEEIGDAEDKGMMVSFSNAWTLNKTVAHIVTYTYIFSMQCSSQEQALDVCNKIEEQMPGQMTSISIQSSVWLDRNPH